MRMPMTSAVGQVTLFGKVETGCEPNGTHGRIRDLGIRLDCPNNIAPLAPTGHK